MISPSTKKDNVEIPKERSHEITYKRAEKKIGVEKPEVLKKENE